MFPGVPQGSCTPPCVSLYPWCSPCPRDPHGSPCPTRPQSPKAPSPSSSFYALVPLTPSLLVSLLHFPSQNSPGAPQKQLSPSRTPATPSRFLGIPSSSCFFSPRPLSVRLGVIPDPHRAFGVSLNSPVRIMGHRAGFEVPLSAFGDTSDPLLCFLGCSKSPCVPPLTPFAFQHFPASAPSDCSLPAQPGNARSSEGEVGTRSSGTASECTTPRIHFTPIPGERNQTLF